MKKYCDKNVYDATVERVEYIFDEFESIYVSLSGGKDSGVCTNLFIEEARKRNRKIGLLFIDIEANYSYTIDFVKEMIEENKDVLIPYWICLPLRSNNSLSYTQQEWIWWDKKVEDLWVRKMPMMEYVINEDNNSIDFWKFGMTFEEFVTNFGAWYSKGKKTACIIGIRTQESLNRWRAIHIEKAMYKKKKYSTKIVDEVYNFYPLYDWKVEDVWVYNAKFNKNYNKLYDLMYYAGVSIHKMRVDEPFGNEAKAGLNMFKVIEPNTWIKVVNRVSGANFGNIYQNSKLMSGNYKLPKGHTWKTFTKFLLATLPKEASNHYKSKFIKFIKYWNKVGCPIEDEEIAFLEEHHKESIINTGKTGNRGKKDKTLIRFTKIPDSIVELDGKKDYLTWKRMAMVIIKNDYWCKSLSFSITKKQKEKIEETLEKYRNL